MSPSQAKNQRFWNRIAPRYAARKLKNGAAYEAMLAAVATRLTSADRVLEIGCGTGGTAIRLAPCVADWKATDFSSQMIQIARSKPAGPRVRFAVADASCAFDDGPFDVICAFNVLHLVDDLPAQLAQIHENLVPGGQFINKTWCFGDLNVAMRALFWVLARCGLFPVIAPLGAAHLQQAILAAGFTIQELRIFGDYSQNPYIVARKSLAQAPVDAHARPEFAERTTDDTAAHC